ncbi:MAG TPA: S-methyl-5-thioribose-1-phosphate isomerase [Ktedonobacterales bacterium]|jgi:methylthioribose-1-phosphate isomerase
MKAQAFQTLWWETEPATQRGVLRMIDQSRLPDEVSILACRSAEEVAEAIITLKVRGAPAIGVAAAYGLALGLLSASSAALESAGAALARFDEIAALLRRTRPTAVNLPWALERMRGAAQTALAEGCAPPGLPARLLAEAEAIAREDADACQRMGDYGAALIHDGDTLLTHCNAGALATAGRGTALAPIFVARAQGKRVHVFVDETRPVLQGARLTTWELQQEGIPLTLITDNMAAHFMRKAGINAVFVGADRIAANGDVANKIGTYGLAILAREHTIPFYVVAPRSTIDLSLSSGEQITIEERPPDEVTHLRGVRIAPQGVNAANPAFDVTPHRYITAIITDCGIARPPFDQALARISSDQRAALKS